MHIDRMGTMTGADLREIREAKGVTFEQAAEATCLRAGFLRELEGVADYEAIPEVYQKLSFCMYARYLGVEMETTRRAVHQESRKSKFRIVPVTNFIRRMGRAPKPPRLDRQQRNRLLTIAKTTSTAVVVVLAVGLYSLNAKLARLNFDEKTELQTAPQPDPEPQLRSDIFSAEISGKPHISLEDNCPLVLQPGASPAPAGGKTD